MTDKVFQTGGSDKHWLFDPQSIETIGPILEKLAVYDTYFTEDDGVTTLGIVLDRILEELPDELEEAVRLVYLAGISYRSAGRTIGVDHKTVKSRAERGVKILRARLTDTVWLATLVGDMLPSNISSNRVEPNDKVFSVLSSLKAIRSGEID
jgi:hypothetical protein